MAIGAAGQKSCLLRCLLKVKNLRCPGRWSAVPPPAYVEVLRGQSNQPRSQGLVSPAGKWAMRMFTPHSTYPPWALMVQPCYFCTPSAYWTAVKDCVGHSRHMAFPSICPFQLAELVCKAGRLLSNPKDIQIISKSLPQGWHTHPQLSVKTTTCQNVVDIPKGVMFSNNILLGPLSWKMSTLTLPLLKNGTWAAALKIAP